MNIILNCSAIRRRNSASPSSPEQIQRPTINFGEINKFSDALVRYLKKNDDPKIKDIVQILQQDERCEILFEQARCIAENGAVPVPIPPIL